MVRQGGLWLARSIHVRARVRMAGDPALALAAAAAKCVVRAHRFAARITRCPCPQHALHFFRTIFVCL